MGEYMAGLTKRESFSFVLSLILGNKEIFNTKFEIAVLTSDSVSDVIINWNYNHDNRS